MSEARPAVSQSYSEAEHKNAIAEDWKEFVWLNVCMMNSMSMNLALTLNHLIRMYP
jgi:hypothetical protein